MSLDLNTKLGKEAVVSKSWSTTPEGGDKKVDQVKVSGKISFEGLTIMEVLEWATRPVIIRRQKVESQLDEIPKEVVVHASSCGKREVSVKVAVNTMTEDQAREAFEALKQRLGK